MVGFNKTTSVAKDSAEMIGGFSNWFSVTISNITDWFTRISFFEWFILFLILIMIFVLLYLKAKAKEKSRRFKFA